MLKFVPDNLKTKKIFNYTVKKLPFTIRYVHGKYNTKKMCNKAIPEIVER